MRNNVAKPAWKLTPAWFITGKTYPGLMSHDTTGKATHYTSVGHFSVACIFMQVMTSQLSNKQITFTAPVILVFILPSNGMGVDRKRMGFTALEAVACGWCHACLG